jgi:lipid-A-disaccharide synthase
MNSQTQKYLMIIAGEPSGDRIAALLAKEIFEKNPRVRLTGLGGPMMKEAGVELLRDMTSLAVVGLIEVLKNYSEFKKIFRQVLNEVDRQKPEAVVLIDFPGFNLRLAKELHRRGIRIIYYVSPQIWAWGKRRIGLIRRVVDRMIVILPFEEKFYREEGVHVHYAGHPIVDYYRDYSDLPDFEKKLPDGRPRIALLPGSRSHEIQRHLPLLLEAAKVLRKSLPGASFVIPCANEAIFKEAEQYIGSQNFIRPFLHSMKECLTHADFAWVCSGTATLETAFFAVPMIVVYKTSAFTAFVARKVIRVPFIGLVNLVAGKQIVPELLQQDFNPENLAGKSLEYLKDANRLSTMKKELEKIREILGKPGASSRAAEIILEAARL